MNRRIYSFLVLLTLLTSCEAQPHIDVVNAVVGKDISSPRLLNTKTVDSYRLEILFDERIFCKRESLSVSGATISSISVYNHTLIVEFKTPLIAAQSYLLTGRVTDISGNSLYFETHVWGFNPHVPSLLINEFTTKGSGNNPDRVELLALEDGNLAGVTLYDGLKDSYDSKTVLPSYEVHKGDYIVIEYSDALRGVHNIEFWGGVVNLGSNNGVITLYDSPEGEIIDAVLYSNRTSDSDTSFGGFGTKKVHERVLLVEQSGQWGPLPLRPESGVDSTSSTATRSFNRMPHAQDTNTKSDWHIVPTSKATFGEENCIEVFE